MKQKISILGSTGSVGVSTTDLVSLHPDKFEIVGLVAGSNLEVLSSQIKKFSPKIVSVRSDVERKKLLELLKGTPLEILCGIEGACAVASLSENDRVVSAIVGANGLAPTLSALKAGKIVCLANKESMVIAGSLMREIARQTGAVILPVDSEHSALFQCLVGHNQKDIKKLILTASGGPFLFKPQDQFASITVAEALNHPQWKMGAKITIDSATLMNKGLEVLEASHLFGVSMDEIEVCIHPQSIIHSMVEFIDGSILAQMGVADMKIPIAYALSYPERISTGVTSLNLFHKKELTFYPPDFEKFPSLALCFEVGRKGETYPAVLNAANEEAVNAFLAEKIAFLDIYRYVNQTVEAHKPHSVKRLEDILEADKWGREYIGNLLYGRGHLAPTENL